MSQISLQVYTQRDAERGKGRCEAGKRYVIWLHPFRPCPCKTREGPYSADGIYFMRLAK